MSRFTSFMDAQHSCPSGIVGRMVGERMARQHVPETQWTLALLTIQPTDDVLEIGFGAGKAIELAAAQASNGHVSGIDLSHAMLQSASRRNAQAIKAGRVTLRYGDVAALPFADKQFDKILSIHTFYFWSDHERALSEIFRVLKPRGTVALTISTGKVGDSKEGDEQAAWLGQYQVILEEQVLPTMSKLGFSNVRLERGPDSREFKTVAVVGVK